MTDPNDVIIDKEISHLKSELHDLEGGFLELTSEIDELKDLILRFHSISETLLDSLVTQYLYEKAGRFVKHTKELGEFDLALNKILQNYDYSKKIKVFNEFNIEPKLVEGLYKLNNMRVEFSHTISHWEKQELYKNKIKYLEALKILHTTMMMLFVLMKTKFPNIYELES